MKVLKLMEIRARCDAAQNSLKVEKEHPEWINCRECPLGGSIEISSGKIDNEYGIDGIKLSVNPCLLLGNLASKVKKRK